MKHLKMSLQKKHYTAKNGEDQDSIRLLQEYRKQSKNMDEDSSDDEDHFINNASPSIGLAIDNRLKPAI